MPVIRSSVDTNSAEFSDNANQMHQAIADTAGHRAIAVMMTFVNHASETDLERLEEMIADETTVTA